MTQHVVPENSDQLRFMTLHDVPDGPITGLRAEYETCGVTYRSDRQLMLIGAPSDREKTLLVARLCGEDIRAQVIAHNAKPKAKAKRKPRARKTIRKDLH